MKASKEQELARNHLIFKCIAGSKSYGTDSPTSDPDTRGIFIATPEYSLGCMKAVEQVEDKVTDTVIYELAKFIRLAAVSNPNIIELLFTDEKNILFTHPIYTKLRENRDMFLSRNVKNTFGGYAYQQLKRMKGHKKWINSPQSKDPPAIWDFATLIWPDGHICKAQAAMSENWLQGAFLVKVNDTTFRIYESASFSKYPISEDGMSLQFIDIEEMLLAKITPSPKFHGTLVVQIEGFKKQHKLWKQYWEWKNNRNKARAELEEKYQIDTKHAMHLVRLLRMADEILTDGQVMVNRPDAEELLEIRNGKWNYEKIIEYANQMELKLEALYKTSPLPKYSDINAINDLYMNMISEYWGWELKK